ncbi:hypothetical protein BB934_23645 [Microvirga ossetica]|uniref:Uncharacterized protein n=1 Tax=Microvirga ossetica TaxID=1882682 RepID=A0A1B2ELJ6_9HYPH|nr:hypothetical protein BB934_23645 [Microvirga ossetica]
MVLPLCPQADPGAALDRSDAPRAMARQFLSMEGEPPGSLAILIWGRPALSRSATASRLNSGLNSRLVFVIKHLPAPEERIRGSVKAREEPRDTTHRLQDRSGRKLTLIRIRRSARFTNRIEQDHRAIKRRIRPILGFKSIVSASMILGETKMAHMICSQQATYAGNPQQ